MKADVNWICEGEPVVEGGDDEQKFDIMYITLSDCC